MNLLYDININWNPDIDYDPEWRQMSKEEYLTEWQLGENEWQEMLEAGAIMPVLGRTSLPI